MTEENKLVGMMRHALGPAAQSCVLNAGGVSLVEKDGVRYLHFGTPWVQGAMRLDDPYHIEFEYVQQMMMWMLFVQQPAHIVQLGLGAGSLSKFCWRQFPQTRVTAIEIDPAVIDVCRASFALPDDDQRLTVIAMDAMDFVQDQTQHGTVDILQLDLYDAQARGPVLGSREFYEGCANCLTTDGMMTINLFCDYPEHQHHLEVMAEVFQAVVDLPEVHDGNIVAIAFKQSPSIDFSVLSRRAHRIRETTGLAAESWVDGLQVWMQGEG